MALRIPRTGTSVRVKCMQAQEPGGSGSALPATEATNAEPGNGLPSANLRVQYGVQRLRVGRRYQDGTSHILD